MIWQKFSICIALNQEEIDQLVARLFDKDPPTPCPASVPTPFSWENLPPVVRASPFTNATIFITDNSILLVILGALPQPSHRCRGVEW
jgi:hypothetical protein